MMMSSMKFCFTIGAMLAAGSALAAVSADEAKQLNGPALTSFGAERAGNKDGSIPEYVGKPVQIPNYDRKEPGRFPDPFATEAPLFSITAQNAEKYADKLDAQSAMFKKYPNYRMDVYPSHRTVTLPKHVLDNTLKNATSCKAVQDELVLEGCYGGIPFPLPKTGNQVMWNHLMAYEAMSADFGSITYIVPRSGGPVLSTTGVGTQNYPVYDPARTTPMKGNDIYWRVRMDFTAPTRKVGEKVLIMDAVDPVNVGRRAYSYIPGQRRVKLAPDLAYDTPSPVSGGAQTMDDTKIFIGALDRFDFKLIGKKEKLIPYNSFKTMDYQTCPSEKILTPNFANPDCVRFEMHRVWTVEARLKPQFRHIYKKRVFYFDEDGYAAGVSENYDASGSLYRFLLGISIPFAEGGANFGTVFSHDLQTGMWAELGNGNYQGGGGYWPAANKSSTYFSPEALAGEGVR